MPSFTSPRERRLWLWALAVVAAIYSTLGLAGRLVAVLGGERLLALAFGLSFLLAIVAVVGISVRRRPGRAEVWMGLAIVAVYVMVVVRMGVPPAERTHLFEYGIVGVLIYEALIERRNNGGRVPMPALIAILATTLVGWGDEGIQAVLPNRVYDLRDVGVNALAGFMAVMASLLLRWARGWDVFNRTSE